MQECSKAQQQIFQRRHRAKPLQTHSRNTEKLSQQQLDTGKWEDQQVEVFVDKIGTKEKVTARLAHLNF